MWYNGSMKVGDGITLGAVVVALGIGVASILHTRSLQKKERRERLLNEIIEWAIDIGKCGKRADLSDLLHIADDKQESFLPIRMTEAALNIGLMEGRNEYISTTALNFGQELQEDVDILIDCLEAYKELLEAESKGVPTAPESIEKLESHDRQLLTLASNVIKKAVKIKTGV